MLAVTPVKVHPVMLTMIVPPALLSTSMPEKQFVFRDMFIDFKVIVPLAVSRYTGALPITPPVMLVIDPPDPFARPLPSPVTVRLPDVPLRTIPLVPPLAEMLRKVIPLAPIVVLTTFSAVPVVESMVLLLAPVVTLIVPPPVALKPAALVVSMFRPPPPKLTVPPALFVSSVTALLVPVFRFLVGLLKLIVPPLLFATRMPCAVEVIEPVPKVYVPPS